MPLLNVFVDALEAAESEGKYIATGEEQRALPSAAKNLASHAAKVINGIIDQLKLKAESILNELVANTGEDDNGLSEDDILHEATDQLAEWAKQYASLVADTEIHAAVQEAILDVYTNQGLEIYWATEDGACPICLANQEASPLPVNTDFPSGDLAPPSHLRCRCSIVPA